MELALILVCFFCSFVSLAISAHLWVKVKVYLSSTQQIPTNGHFPNLNDLSQEIFDGANGDFSGKSREGTSATPEELV